MKIVKVSPRRKHLTALILEDGTELLIDSEIVAIKNLSAGSVIESAADLLSESDKKRARSRAMWYLSRQDHSEKALYDKLIKGGFSPEASRDAVDRMVELGLIDDERYAARLCEFYSEAGKSLREQYAKLILKGVPGSIAKELTAKNGDETDKIRHLIETKYASKLQNDEGVQKVYATLIRKGFSFSDVKAALRDYSENLDNSEDF